MAKREQRKRLARELHELDQRERAGAQTLPPDLALQLRHAGLVVEQVFPPQHVAYPNGYLVGKPATLVTVAPPMRVSSLNSIPLVGAVCLWPDDAGWSVARAEAVPGPGPGDFERKFPSASKAVRFVLEYWATHDE